MDHYYKALDPIEPQKAYRGYLIRTNTLNNSMWIEKGGALIHNVPADKSWDYARTIIDALVA
jgi:hypothetical protein